MSEQQHSRNNPDPQDWSTMTPRQVLAKLVHELYNPVSLIGSQLNHLTADTDPITEEEYEEIFDQIQNAVGRLSKTVVNLRGYVQELDRQDRSEKQAQEK